MEETHKENDAIRLGQKGHNYPTVEEYVFEISHSNNINPNTDIDHKRWRGRNRYLLAKNMYWFQFEKKCGLDEVINYYKVDREEALRLIEKFHKYLHRQIERD